MVITIPNTMVTPGISNIIPRTSAPACELKNDRNWDFIRTPNYWSQLAPAGRNWVVPGPPRLSNRRDLCPLWS